MTESKIQNNVRQYKIGKFLCDITKYDFWICGVLQVFPFVNPLFSVPIHYNLRQVGPNGFMRFVFKHNNWDQFVCSVDNELELEHHNCHGEVLPFGLVWLGMRVDE